MFSFANKKKNSYKPKECLRKLINGASMKMLELPLAAYDINKSPDFDEIGFTIEAKIGAEFPNQWLAMRGISLADHPGLDAAEMESLILKHGTDRYDPNRKGVHHEMDEKFGIELHAVPLKYEETFYCPHYRTKSREGLSALGGFFEDFYHGAKIDRGYPLRIDFLLFYDLTKLEVAPMKWTEYGPRFTKEHMEPHKASCFRFKDSNRKQEALIGLLHLGK